MRGDDQQQSGMFSYVSLEERVPQDHPLRTIRKCVDEVLRSMAKDFDGLYAKTGRPSVPPERLLRAVLLQIFYTVRSERMLMEQMNYNLLFRWFVGLELDEPVWNHAVFSKNRDRLLNQDVKTDPEARLYRKGRTSIRVMHQPGLHAPVANAICNAASVRPASIVRSSAQPITRRENASSTTAR